VASDGHLSPPVSTTAPPQRDLPSAVVLLLPVPRRCAACDGLGTYPMQTVVDPADIHTAACRFLVTWERCGRCNGQGVVRGRAP
jgi:hypothetical protein